MMTCPGDLRYDTSTVISQGRRDRQEDAIIADFPSGARNGFAVLADGMGGHEAGDVASKIVVTEVFSELKLRSGDWDEMESKMVEILENAAHGANQCVGMYSEQRSPQSLMGSTLLAPVVIEDRLFWISVGDSPLFLLRDGAIRRLNDEHALGSQIDYLVDSGLMQRDEAMNHPDQTCLTSVLVGGDIPQIDCPAEPESLQEGDILIASSDGLLVLSEEQISQAVEPVSDRSAERIGAALLSRIEEAGDPNQDNVAFCVIKVEARTAERRQTAPVASRSVMRASRPGVTIVASVSGRAEAAQ